MTNTFSILPNSVQNTENKLRRDILNPRSLGISNSDITTGNNAVNDLDTNAVLEVKGRDYINSKFPDEIEFYACAFELVDSTGKTVEFFSFPVMPSSMNESFQNISSVKKTMSGVVINKNPSFIPFKISISGDFGRRFRNVYSLDKPAAITGTLTPGTGAIGLGSDANNLINRNKKVSNIFDTDNKTGYGSTKILEKIMKLSVGSDNYQKPYSLYFYNLAFNSAFQVDIETFSFSQSKDKNMIWSYSISLKAICPAEVTEGNFHKQVSMSFLRGISDITNEAKQQSSSLELISLDPKTNLSKIEKILYGETKKFNNAFSKFKGKNGKSFDIFDEILNQARGVGESRFFVGTLGTTVSGGLQRFSAFRKSII